jgi:hypothetical protein
MGHRIEVDILTIIHYAIARASAQLLAMDALKQVEFLRPSIQNYRDREAGIPCPRCGGAGATPRVASWPYGRRSTVKCLQCGGLACSPRLAAVGGLA